MTGEKGSMLTANGNTQEGLQCPRCPPGALSPAWTTEQCEHT